MNTTPRRRWRISPAERERIEHLQAEPPGLRTLATIVVRSPRLVPEVLEAVWAGVKDGVATNSGLVWALDSERVRGVVPDAASGVSWVDEELFLGPLRPLLSPEKRVLEVGCGAGRVSRHVAPLVRELVCTDASRALLREARANLAGSRNVRFVRKRDYTLREFADASFDLCFAQGVFSYIDPNPALALLSETQRVLRPGGACVFNFFTIDRPAWAAEARDDALSSARRGRFGASHPRAYSEAQIAALYEAAGLRVRTMVYDGDDERRIPCVVIGEPDA